jgi:hypothetical protein
MNNTINGEMKFSHGFSVSIFIAGAIIALGATIGNLGLAFAIHNDVGHDDKLSLGECYRERNDKDSCQEDKRDWQEAREFSRGPPNGGAADGDPANDVAGPAHPQDPE